MSIRTKEAPTRGGGRKEKIERLMFVANKGEEEAAKFVVRKRKIFRAGGKTTRGKRNFLGGAKKRHSSRKSGTKATKSPRTRGKSGQLP